jgi:drug/metabolite transporter (DMT)-like permease
MAEASSEDPAQPLPPLSSTRTGLLVALLCLLWGSTWIVIQGGLEDLPPFLSAGVRFAIAGSVMAALASRWAAREGGSAPPWRLVLALGTLNFGASYGIVYRTETLLPSGLTSLLWAVFPMLTALLSLWMLPGERLRPVQWLGLGIGLAGTIVLLGLDVRSLGAEALGFALVMLLSPLASAFGNLYVKLHGAGVSSLLLNRNAMFVGAAWLLGAALATEDLAGARWSLRAVGSVLYLSLFGTVVTFGVYYWLLRRTSAHTLALIAYVTPAIALFLGTAVGREPLRRTMLIGTGLILGGVALVVRGPGRKRTDRRRATSD